MATSLDVYVGDRRVGTLRDEGEDHVFTYLRHTPPELMISLTMPVRTARYVWKRGLHPFFQMFLPQGRRRLAIERALDSHAATRDIDLLAAVGREVTGRVGVAVAGSPPPPLQRPINLGALLGSDDSRSLLHGYLQRMDAALGRPGRREVGEGVTAWFDDAVVTMGADENPGRAINEWLCLEVARKAGLPVPAAELTRDGEVLVLDRFDRTPDGRCYGIETMCALSGLSVGDASASSLEAVAKLLRAYATDVPETLRRWYLWLELNDALHHADADLGHFAVMFDARGTVVLAPAYGIATLTAYSVQARARPALALAGRRVWGGRELERFARRTLALPPSIIADTRERVERALHATVPVVSTMMARYPHFDAIGRAMLNQWDTGDGIAAPSALARSESEDVYGLPGDFRASQI